MNITVLGAGAWGSALAMHFALHQHAVHLWTHNAEHAQILQQTRQNQRYLPGFQLPDSLTIHSDLKSALANSELLLIVTPVAGLRPTLEAVKANGNADLPLLTACKGFELNTGLMPFQVVQEIFPHHRQIGLLSGPSFAEELAKQLPCAVCLASENLTWITQLVNQLNTPIMRLYANPDVIGVAVGGAVKNVMAIATGLCDGLGYGFNARSALITRGLAEISRLAQTMGAQSKTLMGLAGMGDLILTCTSSLSRNRQVGLGLATGNSLHQVLAEIGHVAEGVPTTEAVCQLAHQHQIDMPITTALYQLMHKQLAVQDVVKQLMQRDPKIE